MQAVTIDLCALRRSLVNRLRRRGALLQDAEDAIQDAFARLCVAQREDTVRNPAAFLTTVVARVRIDRWRQEKRSAQLFVTEPVEELEIVDPAPGPEDELQGAQRLKQIWRRLAQVSPRTGEVFFLQRIEGLTRWEIAQRLQISVSAIEKHLARAALVLAAERNDE